MELKGIVYNFLDNLVKGWEWVCSYDDSELESYNVDNFKDYAKTRLIEFVADPAEFMDMYGDELQDELDIANDDEDTNYHIQKDFKEIILIIAEYLEKYN